MEFLLQIIVEFFLEFILQIAAELLVDVGLRKLILAPQVRNAFDVMISVVMCFGLGVITGSLSLLIFPHSFIRVSRLHGASLIVIPTLAGLTMAGIGWLRARRGRPRIPLDRFTYGFVFAFGMALVRLLFTT